MTNPTPARAETEQLAALVATVAAMDPARIAVEFDGAAVSYADLDAQLTLMAELTGGALDADTLVQVVLAELFPGVVDAADGAFGALFDALAGDAMAALGMEPSAAATLVDRFTAQVARTPDRVAVQFGDEVLTYAEFDARVRVLAARLVELGVGPETLVGVALRRSVELIVAVHAIVHAGGAYVPLDPDHPVDRLHYVLEVARPVVVVTRVGDEPDLNGAPSLRTDDIDWDAVPGEVVSGVRAGNTAYVIFTSGSTGRPKGVAVTHGAIVANLVWRQRRYGMTDTDVVLQKTPYTFDVSLWELFWPLQVGARLVIVEPGRHGDPAYLAALIAQHRATVTHFVPSMLAAFVGELGPDVDLSSLRMVFASGEALPAATAARLRTLSSTALHNLYGPTEAAVDVTAHEVTAADEVSVPIGGPADHTGLLVLDENLDRVPVGVVGELYLSGIQLARGYVARPGLTADRFVANPYDVAGERMYRTGDLVRESRGELEYLGRTDFQVKLRGLRIELGEIEAVLATHPRVGNAAVLLHRHAAGEALVGYVVSVDGAALDEAELLAHAKSSMPEYMVPSLLVQLDAMPTNASGKLDRKALPEPDFRVSAAEFREPRTTAERAVAALFAELLDVETVGLDDDFFRLGGNSLIATRAIGRLQANFGVRVNVRDFFDSPTVAVLATLVEDGVADDRPALVAGPRPAVVPLSPAQQRMWFLNRFDPETGAYNIPIAVRLSGVLDQDALRAAVGDLIVRHEVLRTVYPEVDGVGTQVVLPVAEALASLAAELLDPVGISAGELPGVLAEVILRGFDVVAAPPVRVRLFEVDGDHVLVLVVHHIASDGWSAGPLVRDTMAAYYARTEGTAPQWAPLPVQYADYTLWQRALLGEETAADSRAGREIAFWRDSLAGLPDESSLPTDRPRPAVASMHGRRVFFELDAEVVAALNAVAAEQGATLFMVLHAALSVLIARLSGTADVAIGTPVAGRGAAELDDVIGMFVNTAVLRTQVRGAEPFAELLGRVRTGDLAAFDHTTLPFERLVEVLAPSRSAGRHPLFQVALSLQNLPPTTFELPGLRAAAVEMPYDIEKFDLSLTLRDSPAMGLSGEFSYATDLFDEPTVTRMMSRFTGLLTAIAAAPQTPVADLPLLIDTELAELTARSGGPSTPAPLLPQVLARAAADPTAIAIRDGARTLTYGELDAASTRLAARLTDLGIGAGDVVAVSIPRSADSVTAIWAVVKSGAGFLPVDPNYPADRIAHMLADSGAAAGITIEAVSADLPTTVNWLALDGLGSAAATTGGAAPGRAVDPLDPAYVIYTSGTTGLPKGVVIPHGAVAAYLPVQAGRYLAAADARVLHVASPSFDISVAELLLTVTEGSTMVVAPAGVFGGAELGELLRVERVTHVVITPSALATVNPDGLDELRVVVVGGEACPVELVARWTAAIPGLIFRNGYGPTETTIVTNISEPLGATTPVTLGAPVEGTTELVLDERLRPVPAGVVGELYIAGAQLARGYHRRPALTAGRFVTNPFGAPGERMYRTGDTVRWVRREDSFDLEYLGRNDFQVKVRGFRIELGEIDAVLARHPSVDFAATIGHRTDAGATLLVSHVVPVAGATIDTATLLAHTAAHLPAHMVPAAIVALDAVPLTPVGKLDRAALPAPVFETAAYRAPETVAEQVVAAAFAEVLGLDRVGRDDDFFDLGGNSLLATRLMARIGTDLDIRIPIRQLFDTTTVLALAAAADRLRGTGTGPVLVAGPRPDPVPLSPAQQRMWFLNRFDPGSATDNIPMAVRLTGALDIAALQAAIVDVLDRHEVLRTRYPELDGNAVAEILPAVGLVPEVHPRIVGAAEVSDAVRTFASIGFDLTVDAPIRASLLRVAANTAAAPADSSEPDVDRVAGSAGAEYVLVIVLHHIAADGFSFGPLIRDVLTAYGARAIGEHPSWAPLDVQYADYAVWQHAVLGDAADPESLVAKQLSFWRDALAGVPEQLDLPTDRTRPAIASRCGAMHSVEIDGETYRALAEFARAQGITVFMAVHAVFAVLLARLSATTDIAIGTPVSGRGDRALDDLVGMFVNTLVLRADVAPATSFTELIAQVRETDLAAFGHADVPFERLVEILDPVRSTARNPLFQVMLSLNEETPSALALPGLTVAGFDLPTGVAKFDLELTLTEHRDENGTPAGISGAFLYATDLFDAATVAGFATRLHRVLTAVLADPARPVGDLDFLDPAEQTQLLTTWNDTATETDHAATLASLLAEQAAATPHAIAVVVDTEPTAADDVPTAAHTLAARVAADGARLGSEVSSSAISRLEHAAVDAIAAHRAGGASPEVSLHSTGDSLTAVELSYAEFGERVARLARHLIGVGAGPGSLVAVAMRRGAEQLVAVHAVLAAGAGYVPVDPDHPAERTAYVLAQTAPVCVLTVDGSGVAVGESVLEVDALDLSGLSGDPITEDERVVPLRPEHLAYVLFTSGSTGRPKGVAVPHKAVVNQLRWLQRAYPLGADDVVLQKTPFTFDASVWELLWPLHVGARLVLATADGHRDPGYLAAATVRHGVSVVQYVPSVLAAVAAEPACAQAASLRLVFAGGEALPTDLARRVRTSAGATVVNLYGPTETAIQVTTHEAGGEQSAVVPIGAPVADTRVYVLDSRLHPVPAGVPGELYVAGSQLADGYHGRPDLTAERFVADPHGTGERLYRTGDLVTWRTGPDGPALHYLGRTDFQVKLRGLRIEPAEIEAAIASVPGVGRVAVLVRSHEGRPDQLVAYVVGVDSSALPTTAELDAAIAATLPSYMVPGAYVFLDELPVTASGKLDRRALPAPESGQLDYREPATATERIVAATFAGVLDLDRVGAGDDFFALGGNSLLATQVAARLGAALDARVPVRELFEASTVDGLAVRLDALRGTGSRRGPVAGQRPQRIPLSPAQQRMWFLHRFDPDSAAYHIPVAIRLSGELDTTALRGALGDLIARHETLRTTYPEFDGQATQLVGPAFVPDLAVAEVEAEDVPAAVVDVLAGGFEITTEVPVRAALLRVAATEHVLVLVVHHIAADGWSMGPLTRDLVTAYAARAAGAQPQLPALAVHYADYALWQTEGLGSADDPDAPLARQLDYWTHRLAGLPDVLTLPADRRRPLIASNRGATFTSTLDADLHRGIEELARAHRASPFMVLHAGLSVLLARLSAGGDIVVGTPVAGRGHRELDDIVGMFVNTLVLRARVDADTRFGDLLDEVRAGDLDAFDNADVPFESLVDALNPARSQGYSPLYQISLALQNQRRTAFELPGLTLSGLTLPDAPIEVDLDFTFVDRFAPDGAPDGLDLELRYATDLFDADTIVTMVGMLERLLRGAVTAPATAVGDLALLADTDEITLPTGPHGDVVALDGALAELGVRAPLAAHLLDAAAARDPQAVAAVFEGAEITYGALAARANRFARRLIDCGVGPETPVAVAVPRGIELLVVLHGVLAAGGVYVPIDATLPADRIGHVLATATPRLVVVASAGDLDHVDSGIRSATASVHFAAASRSGFPVLTVAQLEESVPGADAGTPLTDAERLAPLHPEHPAYVLFTSGSTGTPKGVLISHRAVVNEICWLRGEYGMTAADRFLQRAPLTFDVSLWELLAPALLGAPLVLLRPGGHLDLAYQARVIREQAVTIMEIVPSVLAAMLAEGLGDALSGLRMLHVGGEELPAPLAATVLAAIPGELHNTYGPTEVAITSTFQQITAPVEQTEMPIGRPTWNVRAYVLDERLHLVPGGVAGELYLAGDQLARGYLGRPDLTADRFVADPFGVDGARMYRTGDLVRRDRDGALVYLGRNDFQVKLRGLRIELGEIEAALGDAPGVTHATVLPATDDAGRQCLVGYVAGDVDIVAVRAHVAGRVPAYMVPSHLVVLDTVPLNSAGKLDRAALPAADLSTTTEYVAPRPGAQTALAGVIGELLGVARVGANDDFFAVGGNSLLAMRLVARANAALGSALDVRDVFDAPTVAGLAERAGTGREQSPPLTVVRPRPDRIPLSLAQTRLWLLNRIDPDSAVYTLPIALRLTGDLDTDALWAALADVLDRHESLRTIFPEDADGPTQVVLPVDAVLPATVVREITEADLAETVRTIIGEGYDLTAQPPLRAALLRRAAHIEPASSRSGDVVTRPAAVDHAVEHVLVLAVHHIAADGVSTTPLARDLITAYAARVAGTAPGWEPLPVQYPDFTLWQHAVLGDAAEPESRLARQLAHWRDELAGVAPALELATDRPRPAVRGGAGGAVGFDVPAEVVAGIEATARRHGVSTFMVVHAAFVVLLSRQGAGADVLVGTPVAGRADAALDDLVGMFVNTLVLRTTVDAGAGFAELLAEVRAADLRAFANADLPFERLVDELNPVRSTSYSPIVQVMLAFEHREDTVIELPGLRIDEFALPAATTQFDLSLAINEIVGAAGEPGMRGWLRYATDLFDHDTVAEFGARFVRVLSAVVADDSTAVGEIDLMDAAQTAQLAAWNDTVAPLDADATLVSLFAAQAVRTPDAVALEFEGTPITYGEFAVRVARLARWLITEQVGPGAVVGVGLRRGIDLLVAIYAVQAAGAAYLPLDPDHPADRIADVLATAAPVCVLAAADFPDTGTRVVEPAALDLSGFATGPVTDADRLRPLRGADLAYVLFTSGSTGKPKGVAVTHTAIVNRLVWMQDAYRLDAAGTVLQKTPITFDVSVWELFWPLQIGASLVIARPDGHRDPVYLAELITRTGVDVAHFVPSMLAAFLAEPLAADCVSLRQVFASGEALPAVDAQRLRALIPGVAVHNLYGPTEAAVDVSFHEVTDADTVTVPIGAPVANTALHVLDPRLRPVPVGMPGELYLAGVQLARGYLGRPDLSADRFVANPLGAPGERMYRTGDLVVRTRSGELNYLGRTDFQVKLRGLRIELGEIEAVLAGLETVDRAVVTVRDDGTGEYLTAYLVPAQQIGDGGSADEIGATADDDDATAPGIAAIDLDMVKASLQKALPAYMVPSAFVVLGALPINASGKLDRRALPAPVSVARAFRAPATPSEQLVAGVVAEVLGVELVGADDDFFDLGGNSLIATRVAARLGAALNRQVPVARIFEAPRVAALAAALDADGGAARLALAAGERPASIPLSPAQQRMWFLNRFDPDSAGYNVPIAVRLGGVLDLDALAAAVDDLVGRHEVLRTYYPETADGPEQRILPVGEAGVALRIRDIDAAEIVGAVTALAATTFDVTAGVPWQVVLYRISADEAVLAMVVHHISADGSSVPPLVRDLMTAYLARRDGVAPRWTPLPVQYADYALWQRAVLGDEADPGSVAARQLDFWRGELADLPDELALPLDRPRPAVRSLAGGTVPVTLDADTHARLGALARDAGATLFMVVHTAFAALLGRLSGSADITVGTPVAGRGEAALEDLIGMFVNTLVFRTRLRAGESFEELLIRQRATDVAVYANAEVPFERLVEVLDPTRSTARHPLFQVGFSFQNFERAELALPGITVSGLDTENELSQFDLHLIVSDEYAADGTAAGVTGVLTYAHDVFDAETAITIGARLERLLAAVAATPRTPLDSLDVLEPAERHRILDDWNATAHEIDRTATLLTPFRAQVSAHPAAPALVFDGTELTYAAFDDRVNRLARHLIDEGVGPEVLVALAMRRSIDLVVAIYAVLTAGGAYVPVDPDHPADRIAQILDTARPRLVLTTSGDEFGDSSDQRIVTVDEIDTGRYPGHPVTDGERRAPLRDSNAAYVLFTSGSTGRPKGVAMSHAAIHNQIAWLIEQYQLDGDDVYLQKSAAGFDLSVWGFFAPLAAGATLVLATPEGHRDPIYLAELVAAQQITVVDFVPSMLAMFAAHAAADQLASLRLVFAIGEALTPEAVGALRAKSSATVHNLYGPTEAAVSVTAWPADGATGQTVPIGVPAWNTRVYVLDERLRPVAPGVAGELYLAGAQLARGYLGRPDLSADRFVADPFADAGSRSGGTAGARMYRTGDLVRWTRDGVLVYLARIDFQVKFRGQRIELGEIETALRGSDGVGQAAAVVSASATGDRLVGYVVPTPGVALDPAALRSAVGAVLPSYMVPSVIVVLDAFPLNTSGKLDRKALPTPEFVARPFRAPVTTAQRAVAEVFGEVLGREQVGLDDDFFELGGNSLIATRVAARLGAALSTRVPVRTLFEATTVIDLAAMLAVRAGSGVGIALTAGERPARIPLSAAQQRMWLLNRLDPDTAAYNIPIAVRLTGDVDAVALAAAVTDVLDRHEVLRTAYPAIDGIGHQAVWEFVPTPVVETVDPIAVPAIVAAEIGRGFDVTAAPPVRVRVLRCAADEVVLVVVIHHISADGFSAGPLLRDTTAAYLARRAGAEPGWAPLEVQYADYTLWQRAVLGSEDDAESVAARQLRFWRGELAGLPELLDIPADRPRPAVASHRGASVDTVVPPTVWQRVGQVARRVDGSEFMVAHAALAALLARLSGTGDIAIGTPVAGRGEQALDDLVGMFVNTLVLRTGVDPGASFTALLREARRVDLDAFENAEVPFERLVDVLDPTRSTAHSPLFQVMLAFQNLAASPVEVVLPDLTVTGLQADVAVAKFDLDLVLADTADGGCAVSLTYATDLFDAATAARIVEGYVRMLDAVTANPEVIVGDVDLLTADDRRMLESWCDTTHADVAGILPAAFDRQVAATPEAVALVDGDTVLTYAEFAARVNRLARHLIEHGVGPDHAVAVGVRRSADLVVGVYAVLAAGGTYVPIDPDHPAERITRILRIAQPVCVLTTSRDAADLPVRGHDVVALDTVDLAGVPVGPIADAERVSPLLPEHTAYVIFTSGSTGLPKGVGVPHRAIVNQLDWLAQRFGFAAGDTVLHKTPTTFDASIWELLLPQRVGARTVIARPGGHGDPAYLAALVTEHRIDTVQFAPTLLAAYIAHLHADLADTDRASGPLRRVFAGGEVLPAALAHQVRALTGAEVVNLYGPTETAVQVSSHVVTDGDVVMVPIGAPVWNTGLYVLDARLRPVLPGVTGELYVGGAQLAHGYVGAAELTAERFVPDPFGAPGARMYRTGDLVRLRGIDTPAMEYVGRGDLQVKLNGQRIELGEVEAAMQRLPGVAQAAAAVVAGVGADRLVAYVVMARRQEFDGAGVGATHDGSGFDAVALRAALAAELPGYLVPTVVLELDALPVNTSGKLDRAALPRPELRQATYRAPITETEQLVAGAFARVLDLDRIGMDDNFFDLGGNSLTAVQLSSRLSEALGGAVPVAWFFTDPTPAVVVERLRAEVDSTDDAFAVLLPLRAGGTGAPLFCIHPVGGVSWSFAGLTRHLDPQRPIYGLQSPALTADEPLPASIDDWAERYIAAIREVQPEGPYHLLGWSLGGLLAHAVATGLQADGAQVAQLAMMDSWLGDGPEQTPMPTVGDLLGGLAGEDLAFDTDGLADAAANIGGPLAALDRARIARIIDAATASMRMVDDYRPRRFDGDLVYFAATVDDPSGSRGAASWTDAVEGAVHRHGIDATHWAMAGEAALARIADVIDGSGSGTSGAPTTRADARAGAMGA
ncbi:non-ribosomal peptide synthase/polyketide synthase [Nocardia salmonicida]|uniref:Non-ribosomal peptide synthase/polyketide synthase n=1 Tax=Nocardia salmonicida TaxID=53431 RepID=A0ABZ1N5T3_9NOCA